MKYDPDKHGITQGILSTWRACRYKAKLNLEGWRPKRRKASFRFGSLVHDTLEYMYKAVRENDTDLLGSSSVRRYIAGLVRANLRDAQPSDSPQEIELEGAFAEALLCGPYLDHWEEDRERDWVDVEGTFLAGWDGSTLRGRRDAVYRVDGKHRGLWLLETKTKSQIKDTLEMQLSFDFQTLFYLHTLAMKTGEPVRGCLYNILRKPQLRESKKESREGFLKRVAEDVRERPEHYFKRYELVFPEKVRKRFLEDLRLQVGEFKDWAQGKLPTYRNPNSCVTMYQCEYLEHCSSGTFVGYEQIEDFFPELKEHDHAGKTRLDPKKKTPKRKKTAGRSR